MGVNCGYTQGASRHGGFAAQRRAVRLQNIRQNQAREARVGRELDKERDRKAEGRYNAIFGQKMRYIYSIAREERTRLK